MGETKRKTKKWKRKPTWEHDEAKRSHLKAEREKVENRRKINTGLKLTQRQHKTTDRKQLQIDTREQEKKKQTNTQQRSKGDKQGRTNKKKQWKRKQAKMQGVKKLETGSKVKNWL